MIQYLERQQWVVNAQSEGLSHADSVLQLPFRGNCFNWVLGHIVVHRDMMLDLLNEPPVLSSVESEPYILGSKPLTSEQDVVELNKLLDLSRECLTRLTNAIKIAADETFDQIHNEERGTTVQDRVEFLIWHEGYHIGQLEILRQLAGKDDAII